MPKRLILCNLKELHAAFKSKHPDKKVSFSKFASLRPKWCISVGPKGTHSVCVCTIHQNVKLMLSAVTLSKDYHELIDLIVCDRTSKECMVVHRYESCPGIEVLKSFIEGELLLNDDEDETENNDDSDGEDDDDEKNITFKQWTTCDRSELITCSLPLEDFIAKLCDLLNDITFHSYIAKAQAAYLKKVKENLKSNEVIVLGDFAENHTFLVQDEIQGYHWNNQQCTLHPVVLYYRKDVESDVTSRSICFISNDLKHDVNLVYKVIKDTISYIKANISSDISNIIYFSDGCAGQYKNSKHFVNLCHHFDDFSMHCEWNFFATSHGKSPCDGIGGTVKRLTTRASLQRPISNQILTAAKLK